MRLHIRFYVDVSKVEEAQTVAQKVEQSISAIAIPLTLKIQPYWKIESWYEVSMDFHSTQEDKPTLLKNTMDYLGGRWLTTITQHSNDAIWKKKDDCLVTCEITWMILQVFDEIIINTENSHE